MANVISREVLQEILNKIAKELAENKSDVEFITEQEEEQLLAILNDGLQSNIK